MINLIIASIIFHSITQEKEMSLNKEQFKTLIEETLHEADLYSPEAVNLLLGTAAQESGFGTYLRQIKGPALGVFQMEALTHDDLWNYIRRKDELINKALYFSISAGITGYGDSKELVWNLKYAILMARIHYLRIPEPLPASNDIYGMALYWKNYYNTALGKGTVGEFMRNYKIYVEEI